MRAEIITIGDEILIGQIVDTNSAFTSSNFTLALSNNLITLSILNKAHHHHATLIMTQTVKTITA